MSQLHSKRPFIHYSLPQKKASFCKLRHIKYLSKLESTPKPLRKFSSVRFINHALISFPSKEKKYTEFQTYFRRFSQFLKHILVNKTVHNIQIEGHVIFNIELLKSLILKATRLRGISVTLKDQEAQILPYLKQIQYLTLNIVSPIENFFPDHATVDTLNLLGLIRLKHLELVILDQDVPGLKLQPKHLTHLMTIISDPKFKASVSIKSSEFVAQDKTITVIPPYKGASHITSLDLGHMDEESFSLMLRTSHVFKNLKNFNFTLKMSKRNLEEYLHILPFLAEMNQLKSLGASFMLPFFHFDSQGIFRSIKFPKDIKEISLHFYPITFCPIDALNQSDFIQLSKHLGELNSLKTLSLHLVISEHMEACYSWIQNLPVILNLENLKLQLDYHVEPKQTENIYVKDIFEWVSKLPKLQSLELTLDFPNFFGLENLIINTQNTLKSLKRFVFKTPKDKTYIDDNFSPENLAYLLKVLEPSYKTMQLFELDVSSVNFNEECFGLLLHALSGMKKLRKFDCAINEGEFTKPMFEAFEESLKSLDSLEEVNLTTDVEMKEKQVPNASITKEFKSEGILEKVSHLFEWRN